MSQKEARRFKHWAYLNDEGKKLWSDVFPTGEVPVLSMIPMDAELEDHSQSMRVFLIYHEELTEDQLDKILTKLSEKFNAPKELIRKDMAISRIPLRAELTNGAGTNHPGLFL